MTPAEAIAVIEECIAIHRNWSTHMQTAPTEVREAPVAQVRAVGDVDWHETWISRYEGVLSVLRDQAVASAPTRPSTGKDVTP